MLSHLLPLLLLSFAVSVDGFGVGITYGLRRIRIPLLSVLIITGCSGVVILLSMKVGAWLTGFVDPDDARRIGALILIGIGCFTLFQQLRPKRTSAEAEAGEEQRKGEAAASPDGSHAGAASAAGAGGSAAAISAGSGSGAAAELAVPSIAVLTLEIKKLGIVIQILRSPQTADVDSSGSISAGEALLLGSALSLDAFGAGLGAAMVGLEPWLTALSIMLASGLFLAAGLRFGFRFSGGKRMKLLSVLPGTLLLLIGLGKLW
ncbi:manganese efflux pump [Paenibacillus pasadenensis]|uniref:manganese efflux pump n=1 Tax=Paenibacillus pasadenensis TaxID=217090 RepID=UPI0004235CC6|nr:manganese efflux pump [Paenibacillus pasadenensis]